MRRLPAVMALTLAAALAGACGDPAVSVFAGRGAATTPETFYDLPFPHDARRLDTGALDLRGFPAQSMLVDRYIDAATTHLDGFGLNSGIFFRFDGELDPGSFPDPEGSIADDASIYLVDVDPDSPARGQRTPIVMRFHVEAGSSIGPDWLAILPYPGFPLAEGTTYAAVVTDRVRSADVDFVLPGVGFIAVRDRVETTDPELRPIQLAMEPLWTYLDEPGGDARENVVTATVFTTQHATGIVGQMRDRIDSLVAPAGRDVQVFERTQFLTVFQGVYGAPNFQRGPVPYEMTGGDIQIADDGLPLVQVFEELRFAVSVPAGPMPANGWPIAIYQHGTGGDYLSFHRDGTSGGLATQGIAVVSMDQVLHWPRNTVNGPELAFFNFFNPHAARDNTVQGAADSFSLARMITSLAFDDNGTTVRFDPARLMYFGHSQGSTTGAPYVAYARDLQGAVLSGAGGVLYLALLNKTAPVDIPSILQAALREEPFDQYNPTLSLLQAWIERADSVNYGPLMVRTPPPGLGPRPVYISEGITDTYTPLPCIEALGIAVGADLIEPVRRDVPGITLRGRSVRTAPITDNLDGTTAVLVQYPQAAQSDGHYVVFDVPAAMIQSRRFLGTLANDGAATLVAPP